MTTTVCCRTFLQNSVKTVAEKGGFDRHIAKILILSGGDGKCTAQMNVSETDLNRRGTLHGGLSATLVDNITTLALMTTGKKIPGISTELSVSFLSPVKPGENILIEAETLKTGRTLAYLQANIKHLESGKLIAVGRHTKFVG